MYITWQGISLNEDKLNWWCVYVYGIVDEIGHFDLLVFQSEFEYGNEGMWLGVFIEIIVLDVSYPRELTLLNLEF